MLNQLFLPHWQSENICVQISIKVKNPELNSTLITWCLYVFIFCWLQCYPTADISRIVSGFEWCLENKLNFSKNLQFLSALSLMIWHGLVCTRGSVIAKIVGLNVKGNAKFTEAVNMYVYEELINGRKLTEIINTEHENVKYLPGCKLPANIVSAHLLLFLTLFHSSRQDNDRFTGTTEISDIENR